MAMNFPLNNWVELDGSFSAPTSASFAFWMKINDLHGSNRLFGGTSEFEIRTSGDTLLNEMYISGTGLAASTDIVEGVWYHVVATSVMGGVAKIFVNGQLENTGSCGYYSAGSEFYIGSSVWADNQGADAVLDDVRLYDRILEADEVMTIHAARGIDGIINGLRNRWLLNGVYGSTPSGGGSVVDVMGRQNGTPHNNPTYDDGILRLRKAA